MPQKNRTVKGALGGVLGLVGLGAVAGLLVTASVTPVLAMTGIAGSQALTIFDKLPANLDVTAPMEQSTIYATASDGSEVELASFYEQNRTPVTFDQVNPVVYDAILSSEDKDYFSHGGINVGSTAKALVDNVRGTSSRGASTITQQYVKNVLIQECEQQAEPSSETYSDDLQKCWEDATNATGNEGVARKLQEMRFALQIEKEYSKNDILLGYLNIANFGGTVYGIEAAANYYFNTTAANLSIAQAATIAGMVQNPNQYRIDLPGGTYTVEGVSHNSVEDGYADTLDRRHYVLGRMLADGKITQAQYDEADASPIEPTLNPPTQGCAAASGVAASAYFCEYVKSIVLSDEAFGEDDDARRDLLRQGGLKIYTTMNLDVQNASAAAMAEYVPANPDNQDFGAAGVSIEASSGKVLAITQNTTFSETVVGDQAYSALVLATDSAHGGSGGFSVGSTYKLFTLIDWLEKGHSLRETLNGNNRRMTIKAACQDASTTFDTKEIGNFNRAAGYNGNAMTFTKNSLNSGFFAMAEKLDLCDINEVATRMGVTLAKGGSTTDENVPFDVLGSKYISPLAMAGAYATVANKGIYCTPTAISRVVNNEGADIPIPETKCSQVISPEVAATAAYALQGVMVNGGTGVQANPFDGVPVIGKTGTHNGWGTMMIESSTKVTSAVWVGRTQGEVPINQSYYNGRKLSDLRYPVAKAMQSVANSLYGGESFPPPDNRLNRIVMTDVPNVVGQTIEAATATLQNAGFTVAVGAPIDSDQATNLVAAQDPAGQAAGGATVTLSPSNGQGTTVPDVSKQSRANAQTALLGAGFSSIQVDGSCNQDDATVSSTDPAAGTATNKSTRIRITCE